MSTVPHVHTESWWWGPLAAAVLAHAVWRHPPRVAAACAWAFGTAWMVAGTWWLFISLNRYGGMPAPLAAASVFALGAALSLYWAAPSKATQAPKPYTPTQGAQAAKGDSTWA
ncbi:MAG: hypothetical protein ACKOER_04315 [Betaproteobacteria bacterium]